MTRSREYSSFANAKALCNRPRHLGYKNYGGRGIKVCAQWTDSRTFVADIEELIGPRPEGCTLDRKDNDGDYEPGNVQWSTKPAQSRNTRKSLRGSVRSHGSSWGFRVSAGGYATEEEARAAQRRAVALLEEAGLLL